jgi:hypothetical protein
MAGPYYEERWEESAEARAVAQVVDEQLRRCAAAGIATSNRARWLIIATLAAMTEEPFQGWPAELKPQVAEAWPSRSAYRDEPLAQLRHEIMQGLDHIIIEFCRRNKLGELGYFDVIHFLQHLKSNAPHLYSRLYFVKD